MPENCRPRGLKIDFDCELSRGLAAYEDSLADWWKERAADRSHARAYRRIAGYVGAAPAKAPRLILDYACGAGHLLARFSALFPRSRLIGLDGSSRLLDLARRRLSSPASVAGPRAELIETRLPLQDLPRFDADIAAFTFPNLVWSGTGNPNRELSRGELTLARELARRGDCDEAGEDPAVICRSLVLGRLVAQDLRAVLRSGGLCVRAEYARCPRDELLRTELMRAEFEEGSLDVRSGGATGRPWFRVVSAAYFRSLVIEDVDQQAGRPAHAPGGYVITVLRAV